MSNTSINCTHQGCPKWKDNLTEAAEAGTFGRFNEHLDHLDSIVAPNGNTILHIHLSRQREISTDFIEQVVLKCPRLLLSQENCDGNTPLHIAASHGYTDVAEKLIWLAEVSYDALETQRGEVATETLRDAVDTQHSELATEMLHDAVETHSVEVATVTLHDVDTKSGEVAIEILDNEADIQRGEVATETLHDALDTQIGEMATETLHDAVDTQSEEVATDGRMEAVREMLRKLNNKRETALHVAARNGRSLGVVKAILSKEDPHFTYSFNVRGETPLYLAVDNTCTDTVAELLNNPNSQSLEYGSPDGDTVLHKAVELWDTEVVRILLEKQSSLAKEKDWLGWTPLHVAAKEGSSSMVATLLDKDKSIAHVATKLDMTALHIAAFQGQKHAMNEIISKCSDCCKLIDREGNNVLHYAVRSKNEEVLREILENSSLISLIIGKDNDGNTPVHLFKARKLPLPTFILDGDTDAFILWKKLYHNIPKDFTIKGSNLPLSLERREEILHIMKYHPEYKTKREKKREEKIILQLKEAKDSHLVAAALVATVTFAAAFTLPGGYISDENNAEKGTPILSKNSAFKVFIISDTIAMAFSTSSVFMYFIMVMLGYGPKYYWLIKIAFRFILLAMGAMVVAFVTGTYAVLAPSLGLAIPTCTIGLSFFLFWFCIFIRLCCTPRYNDYDDGRILTLSWLSFGGWWLINEMPSKLLDWPDEILC